jgi:hypothetical protein
MYMPSRCIRSANHTQERRCHISGFRSGPAAPQQAPSARVCRYSPDPIAEMLCTWHKPEVKAIMKWRPLVHPEFRYCPTKVHSSCAVHRTGLAAVACSVCERMDSMARRTSSQRVGRERRGDRPTKIWSPHGAELQRRLGTNPCPRVRRNCRIAPRHPIPARLGHRPWAVQCACARRYGTTEAEGRPGWSRPVPAVPLLVPRRAQWLA